MVTFDGDNKIIQVDNSITELNLNTDVYLPWKEWLLNGNQNFEQALDKIGGQELVTGRLFLPVAFILKNGWKIRPFESQHILTIRSNLYTDDDSLPYILPAGINIEVNLIQEVCEGLTNHQSDILDILSSQMAQTSSQILEIWRLMGLDINSDVKITPTSRITNGINQEFIDSGLGNITINRY